MKCTDIMSKNLEWLTEKDTVFKAATVMAEAGSASFPSATRTSGRRRRDRS